MPQADVLADPLLSCAIHSIVLDPACKPRPLLASRFKYPRVLEIGAQGFSSNWARYYCLSNKLSYLITAITGGQIPDGDSRKISDEFALESLEFANLRKVLFEQMGCELRLIPGSEGHFEDGADPEQAHRVCEDLERLSRLLFGKESYIEVGNLKNFRPRIIATDQGLQDQFRAHYAPLPAFHRQIEVALELSKQNLPIRALLPDGFELNGTESVASVFCRHSVVTRALWHGPATSPPWQHCPDLTGSALLSLTKFASGLRFVEDLPVEICECSESESCPNKLVLTLACAMGTLAAVEHYFETRGAPAPLST